MVFPCPLFKLRIADSRTGIIAQIFQKYYTISMVLTPAGKKTKHAALSYYSPGQFPWSLPSRGSTVPHPSWSFATTGQHPAFKEREAVAKLRGEGAAFTGSRLYSLPA
ncbi:MAG: hypothetical protein LBB83_01325, partial [Treponema sp.]|nr:hypothetical protein [Treponema sp.]